MKHKDLYNDKYIEELSQKLLKVSPNFNHIAFSHDVIGHLEDKELFSRIDFITDTLIKYMSSDYSENVRVFFDILGPELKQPEGMFNLGWWLWPFSRYIERYGNEDWQLSLAFIKELTKRFTGEFAIRPLLKEHPVEILDELINWTKEDNVHVRRLASEGVRIRLPWSKKLLVALDNFDKYSILLTNLKDDTEKYVQKSVGNNLNDLYKESPEKAEILIEQWQSSGQSKAQDWIIKHGMRTQRKRLLATTQTDNVK